MCLEVDSPMKSLHARPWHALGLCLMLLVALGLCLAQAEDAHTHEYVDGVCTGCGTALPELKFNYTGPEITKVYDKTRNVYVIDEAGQKIRLAGSDFVPEDLHGFDLSVKAISAVFDVYDVGARTIDVTITFAGADAGLYPEGVSFSLSGTITPKPLIVTPGADLKKLYGEADPSSFNDSARVRGLYTGDRVTGKLSREPGENVGKYRILQGTIDAGGNYEVQVAEQYFTIEPMPIDSDSVSLASIGNQRYTGEPIEPALTLRRGEVELQPGVDFAVEYTDNTEPGVATVKLIGMGNYTGERSTSFRILRVVEPTYAISVAPAEMVYTGTPLEPRVTLTRNGAIVEDATALFGNNYQPGSGVAIATDPATDTKTQTSFRIWDPADLNCLTLPAGIKRVEKGAFQGTPAQMVVIPDGCVEIGSLAFADCDGLLDVRIPASVTVIAPDAFGDSTDFTIRTPGGSDAAAFAQAHGIFWYAQ